MFTSIIFPNIAVRDLKKSIEFFGKLGFTFNEKFTNESGTAMKVNDSAYVMLLTEPFFLSFTTKGLTDTSKTTEIMLAVSFENKAKVDELVDKAVALGAKEVRKEDLGFMYSRAFHDLDGHIWEFFWMDEQAG